MSEPSGPVYLSIPQETAMLPMPGTTPWTHVPSPHGSWALTIP